MRRKRKESLEDRAFHIGNTVIMVLIGAVMLYPLYYIVLASVTDPTVVNTGKLLLYPEKIYLEGYKAAFEYGQLFTGFANSVLYTAVGTVISIFLTIPGAYALSRKDLRGRNAVMFLCTFTMFFSGGMVPTYMLVNQLGLIDTMWAMVLPGALSVYNLIVVRTFFQTNIPEELLEAAKMDGCTDLKFFWHIALKVSGTIIAVMVLFYAVGLWNSYFNAIMYLNSRSRMPLQAVLRDLLILNTVTNELPIDATETVDRMMRADQLKYCVIIISTVPMMVLYPFIQKHFTKGVMIGSIKG
ncbi:MAG: carbohydrate ABC transporter permease [Eubacteriales bacterium]|nr:carbohydrate ABC transporter permease [Eubacteriales bacterium]